MQEGSSFDCREPTTTEGSWLRFWACELRVREDGRKRRDLGDLWLGQVGYVS